MADDNGQTQSVSDKIQRQDTKKMKHMLTKQKTSSTIVYKQLNEVYEQHLANEFDYFKAISDFRYIVQSLFLDLDLLSDSMAVCTCYVLSQSMNLSQEIRNELDFYYRCSLTVLLISILPKWNCYLFWLLRLFVQKVEMIEKEQNQERLVEQNSCFKKLIFQLYRMVSRFYGINYNKDNNYVFDSKDISKDMIRLFYANHEDIFTAEQFNPTKQTADLLSYHEMEKKTHSSLRIYIFRTFFENIPQLGLQVMMVYILQKSGVEGCKKTDFTFYQSIITTSLNMVFGFIMILSTVLKKILDGDLVVWNMKVQFDKYLKQNKLKNTGDIVWIKDKIDFYPKMIYSIYQFLLENSKYRQIQFGSGVVFRGDIKDYCKVVEFVKGQDLLSQAVKTRFQNQDKFEKQIIAELTVKKIFEELVITDSHIECDSVQNRFVIKCGDNQLKKKKKEIKCGDGYRYDFGTNIENWVRLMEQNKVEIQIGIRDSWEDMVIRLSKDQIERAAGSL